MSNTQLTTEFKAENLIFGNLIKGNIPNTNITFHRIPIQIKNADGTIGDLVLPTEQITSFGVEEETDLQSVPKGTYKFSLALWNMNGPTKEEEKWTDSFMKMAETCKDKINVLSKSDDFPYLVNKSDLDDMVIRAIYWGKRDNKKKLIQPDMKKPYLSPKLMFKYVDGEKKVTTQFYDEDGEDVDFQSLKSKRVLTKSAIKIESIFCKKGLFSFQIKLLEAEVKFIDTKPNSLMRPSRTVKKENIENISVVQDISSDESSDEESEIENSE